MSVPLLPTRADTSGEDMDASEDSKTHQNNPPDQAHAPGDQYGPQDSSPVRRYPRTRDMAEKTRDSNK